VEDEGFGYAIAAKADRDLLLHIAEIVYPADLSGQRQSEASVRPREGQLIVAE
jgi:hypothetical protein